MTTNQDKREISKEEFDDYCYSVWHNRTTYDTAWVNKLWDGLDIAKPLDMVAVVTK